MKKIITLTAILMTLLSTSCGRQKSKPQLLEIDNRLTNEELAAGILTPEVMWKMGRIGAFALSPDGTQVVYGRTDYNMTENRGVTTLWVQNTGPGFAKKITDNIGNATNPVWSADGERIYFLSNSGGSSQVWSIAPDGSELKQISRLKDDIEAFGIAPSGDKVFYIQRVMVDTKIAAERHPDLDKSKASIHDELMVRHWDRWTDGSHMHIFIADWDGKKLKAGTDIMAGEPYDSPMEPYFDAAEIAWNNAGTALAYTCKKMDDTQYALSTDSDIYVYDLASGLTTDICTPEMVGYDRFPVFSPDDKSIAFRSMARAGNESDKDRLMVYDFDTQMFTDLTAEFDYNVENLVWNGSGEIMFTSPMLGGFQFCKVGVASKKVEVVTSGDHNIYAFSRSGGVTVASRTRQDHALELYTLDTQTGAMAQLTNVNDHIFSNIQMGAVEKRWIETTDGEQMLTWVVFPPDFDPTKKYPALLYCEGGPQSDLSQFWSYRWNFQLMAARGYIVVAPNRRGTLGFGQQWTDQISGDYAGQNITDLLTAIDEVAKEPWVDATRLGCVGASYGGYSAFYLAGVHKKRFKAFIAHCGIFDFDSMYGSTEELFFVNNDYGGPYWSDDPVAVRSYKNSPHKLVKNWDTPILIITGLRDFRIPYTQSIEAHTAARLLGVPSRLVAFEDEAHQIFKPQNSLVWNREFFAWLDKYLR